MSARVAGALRMQSARGQRRLYLCPVHIPIPRGTRQIAYEHFWIFIMKRDKHNNHAITPLSLNPGLSEGLGFGSVVRAHWHVIQCPLISHSSTLKVISSIIANFLTSERFHDQQDTVTSRLHFDFLKQKRSMFTEYFMTAKHFKAREHFMVHYTRQLPSSLCSLAGIDEMLSFSLQAFGWDNVK